MGSLEGDFHALFSSKEDEDVRKSGKKSKDPSSSRRSVNARKDSVARIRRRGYIGDLLDYPLDRLAKQQRGVNLYEHIAAQRQFNPNQVPHKIGVLPGGVHILRDAQQYFAGGIYRPDANPAAGNLGALIRDVRGAVEAAAAVLPGHHQQARHPADQYQFREFQDWKRRAFRVPHNANRAVGNNRMDQRRLIRANPVLSLSKSLAAQNASLLNLATEVKQVKPPVISLKDNPSNIAVCSIIRETVFQENMKKTMESLLQEGFKGLSATTPIDDEFLSEDALEDNISARMKLPKVVSLGLSLIFQLIRESRTTSPSLCIRGLQALLETLQAQIPESLKNEPPQVSEELFDLLLDIACYSSLDNDDESEQDLSVLMELRSLACCCLVSLVISLGDTGKMLKTVCSLLTSPKIGHSSNEDFQVPQILISLQRSVQTVIESRLGYQNSKSSNNEDHQPSIDCDPKKCKTRAYVEQTYLSSDLSLPTKALSVVSRSRCSLHILSSLDCLTRCHSIRVSEGDNSTLKSSSGVGKGTYYSKEDFNQVNRFESHGGGWGYSGHSIEAIRFSTDTDVLLGGIGLFGGRGEYIARLRVYDIGCNDDEESEGDIISETPQTLFESPARQDFPIIFEEPVEIFAHRWYVAWAMITGPSSDCGSSGQSVVKTDDNVTFFFKSSKKSNNGTDVNAGQIPTLLYRILGTPVDLNSVSRPQSRSNSLTPEQEEPVVHLSRDFFMTVSVEGFTSLHQLLSWSWRSFISVFLESSSSSHPLLMTDLKHLSLVCTACLHLLKVFINEVLPSNHSKRRRMSRNLAYISDASNACDAIAETRSLLKKILTTSVLSNLDSDSPSHVLLDQILQECISTFSSCYHALYPSNSLRWRGLLDLLFLNDSSSVNGSPVSPRVEQLLSVMLSSIASSPWFVRQTFRLNQFVDLRSLPVNSPIVEDPLDMTFDNNFEGSPSPPKEAMLTSLSYEGVIPSEQSLHGLLVNRMAQVTDEEQGTFCVDTSTKDVILKLLNIIKQPIESSLYCNHLKIVSPDLFSEDESLPKPLSDNLVKNTCYLVCSMIQELVSQSLGVGGVVLTLDSTLRSRTLLSTPSRFAKVCTNRTWNTGNGSPEAIAFTVDQSVMIVGVTLFGGSPGKSSDWNYELELLDSHSNNSGNNSRVQVYDRVPDPFGFDQFFDDMDPFHAFVRDRPPDLKNPTVNIFRPIETVKGSYGIPITGDSSSETDAQFMAEVKFERPVQLHPNIKYALRLRNNGPRTANGDGGVSTVRGPDGTVFTFSDCPLSFNGTNHSRGQFGNILYYSTTDNKKLGRSDSLTQESSMRQLQEQEICRRNLLSVSESIVQAVIDLIEQSIDDGSYSDPNILEVVSTSRLMSHLLPMLCSSLIPVVKSDAKIAVAVILLMKRLLPVICIVNKEFVSDVSSLMTTSRHTVIVESDHPYKSAGIIHQRVSFPSSVRWMSIQFDKRSATVQPEDYLQLYIPSLSRARLKDKRHSFLKKSLDDDNVKLYSVSEVVGDFLPIFDKFSGSPAKGNWPHKTLLLPGNEIIFSLETASDYVKSEDKSTYFGFRCQVSGYDVPPEELSSLSGEESFCLLEQEINFLSVTALSSLLSRSLMNSSLDSKTIEALVRHSYLLSQGLSLSHIPSPEEALQDGSLPLSHDQPFLKDFVNCTPGTSGGRLAKWLQPESFVDTNKCVVQSEEKVTCGSPAVVTIILKDQYDEVVNVPGLRVLVTAQPLVVEDQECDEDKKTSLDAESKVSNSKVLSKSSKRKAGSYDQDSISSINPSTINVPYSVTTKDKMRYHAISMIPAYQSYSFEELRFVAPVKKKSLESVMVTSNNDGSFSASWTPASPGLYRISVVIDGQQIPPQVSSESVHSSSDTLIIQVLEAPPKRVIEKASKVVPKGSSSRDFLNRQRAVTSDNIVDVSSKDSFTRSLVFIGRESCGLRIRSLPSLTSTQIGIIPPSAVITFIHEVQNEDGVWVRLTNESLMKYCSPGSDPYHSNTEGYALSFNQHVGQVLLSPLTQELEALILDTQKPQTQAMSWSSSSHHHSRRKRRSKDKDRSHRSHKSSRERLALNNIVSLPVNGCPDITHAVRSTPGVPLPCQYRVVNTGSCGHNVRSGPAANCPAVGMVIRGNVVTAVDQITKLNETWIMLSSESLRHFCLKSAVEAWTLSSSIHPITGVETHYLLPDMNAQNEQQEDVLFREAQDSLGEDAETETDLPLEDPSEEDNEDVVEDVNNRFESPETEYLTDDEDENAAVMKSPENEGSKVADKSEESRMDEVEAKIEKAVEEAVVTTSMNASTATTTSSGFCSGTHSSSLSSSRISAGSQQLIESSIPDIKPIVLPEPSSTTQQPPSTGSKVAEYKKMFSQYFSSLESGVSSLANLKPDLPSLPVSVKEMVSSLSQSRESLESLPTLSSGVQHFTNFSGDFGLPRKGVFRTSSLREPAQLAHKVSERRNTISADRDTKSGTNQLTKKDEVSSKKKAVDMPRTTQSKPRSRHLPSTQGLQRSSTFTSKTSNYGPLVGPCTGIKLSPKKKSTASLDASPKSQASELLEQKRSTITVNDVDEPVITLKHVSKKDSLPTTAFSETVTSVKKIDELAMPRQPKTTASAAQVKNAMSNSMAESIRAVFAAFVWHEGILHDCIAAASFLKFNSSDRLSKDVLLSGHKLERIYNKFLSTDVKSNLTSGGRRQKNQRVTDMLTRQQKAKNRHSLDVLRSLKSSCNESFLNANFIIPPRDEILVKKKPRRKVIQEEEPSLRDDKSVKKGSLASGDVLHETSQAKKVLLCLQMASHEEDDDSLRDSPIPHFAETEDSFGDNDESEEEEEVPETLSLLLLLWHDVVKACMISLPYSSAVQQQQQQNARSTTETNVPMDVKQRNYVFDPRRGKFVEEDDPIYKYGFHDSYIEFPGSILSPSSPRREHLPIHLNRHFVSLNDFRDSSSSLSSDRVMPSLLDSLQGNNLNSEFLEQQQPSLHHQRNNIVSRIGQMMNHHQVNLFGEAALANQAVVRRNNNKARNSFRNFDDSTRAVECELCSFVQEMDKSCHRKTGKSITHHMRSEHPGCGRPCEGRGYNSRGEFSSGWSGSCGYGGVSGISDWYLMCDACRVRYLLAKERIKSMKQKSQEEAEKKPKKKSRKRTNQGLSPPSASGIMPSMSSSSHEVYQLMKDNALFLLRLSSAAADSLASSTAISSSRSQSNQEEQIFPHHDSFACLESFGFPFSKSYQQRMAEETLTKEEIRAIQAGNETSPRRAEELQASQQLSSKTKYGKQFERSVSIGWRDQTEGGDVKVKSPIPRLRAQSSEQRTSCTSPSHVINSRVFKTRDTLDQQPTLSSSLVSHPSKSLTRLINMYFTNLQQGESRTSFAISTPVLAFVRDQQDLHSLSKDMKASIRKACCRNFALQGMTWLLRSVTQPTALHDIMWSFVSALDPVQESEASVSVAKESSQSKERVKKSSSVDDFTVPEELDKSIEPIDGNLRVSSPVKRSLSQQQRQEDVPKITSSSRDASLNPVKDVMSAGEEVTNCLRKSFHEFLASVSDLMLLLPQGSPLQTMAISSFYLDFDSVDHSFLHSCHVFSNISKILSRSEDDGEVGQLSTSMPTSPFKSHHHSLSVPSAVTLESLSDITSSLEIKTSSRSAMISSLTDHSTETFWESGDEDKHKRKVITVNVSNPQMSPRVIYVHVDNVRDSGSKTSFIMIKISDTSSADSSTSSTIDFVKLLSRELDFRFAGWVSCMIPFALQCKTIKIELKTLDNSLRVRQLTVMGVDAGKSITSLPSTTAFSIYQKNCETETLKVFRLLTSQVFGRLINHSVDDSSSEVNRELMSSSPRSNISDVDVIIERSGMTQSCDLREHMLGILFSRSSKFSLLQKQVCSHIVSAIRVETQRLREEWEASLCSPSTSMTQEHDTPRSSGDSYCFEMLSMVLALSGSAIGRSYLAQQEVLLSDLLSLLHTSTARVQRQVVSLLRRVLPEIKPSFLASLLKVKRLPKDPVDVIAKDAADSFDDNQVGLLDILLSCVAKALTIQTKTRGSHHKQGKNKTVATVTLATCIHPKDECVSPDKRWFLKGCMSRKMAEMVIDLLKDMSCGKLGDKWTTVTANGVCESILNLTRLPKEQRTYEVTHSPVLWLSLASLCLLSDEEAEKLSSLHLKPKKKATSEDADGNGNDDSVLQESQVSFSNFIFILFFEASCLTQH